MELKAPRSGDDLELVESVDPFPRLRVVDRDLLVSGELRDPIVCDS